MLYLNITQQFAKLGLNTTAPFLSLHTTPPTLEIERTPATVEIHQQNGDLQIDQTPCRASLGIYNLTDFAHQVAAEGQQAVLSGIARRAEEGDQLTHNETQQNVVVAVARQEAQKPIPELTYAWIDAPQITYTAHPVEFTPMAGQLSFNAQPGTVQGDFRRGTVEPYLLQSASIRMWVTEGKYDVYA